MKSRIKSFIPVLLLLGAVIFVGYRSATCSGGACLLSGLLDGPRACPAPEDSSEAGDGK